MIGIAAVTALSAAFLAGCQAKLMPTPVAFAHTGIDPITETSNAKRTTTSRVFLFQASEWSNALCLQYNPNSVEPHETAKVALG